MMVMPKTVAEPVNLAVRHTRNADDRPGRERQKVIDTFIIRNIPILLWRSTIVLHVVCRSLAMGPDSLLLPLRYREFAFYSTN